MNVEPPPGGPPPGPPDLPPGPPPGAPDPPPERDLSQFFNYDDFMDMVNSRPEPRHGFDYDEFMDIVNSRPGQHPDSLWSTLDGTPLPGSPASFVRNILDDWRGQLADAEDKRRDLAWQRMTSDGFHPVFDEPYPYAPPGVSTRIIDQPYPNSNAMATVMESLGGIGIGLITQPAQLAEIAARREDLRPELESGRCRPVAALQQAGGRYILYLEKVHYPKTGTIQDPRAPGPLPRVDTGPNATPSAMPDWRWALAGDGHFRGPPNAPGPEYKVRGSSAASQGGLQREMARALSKATTRQSWQATSPRRRAFRPQCPERGMERVDQSVCQSDCANRDCAYNPAFGAEDASDSGSEDNDESRE